MRKTALLPLLLAAWFGLALSSSAAPEGKALAIPDFTKGDPLLERGNRRVDIRGGT